ncbi:MAG: hypothetical protein PVI30_27105 [Myxococcales bacterium]|jgi:hypothetical protein
MSEPDQSRASFEAELQGVEGEVVRWLGATAPEQACDELAERFGPPDARRGALARGVVAALVDADRAELSGQAAELIERVAASAGEGPVTLWDRWEEGLERLRDLALCGLPSAASVPAGDDAAQHDARLQAWAAVITRRRARAAVRQARTIRADLTATGARALLLLAGAWVLGLRTMAGRGWIASILIALATAMAGATVHRMLLPRDARPPSTFRERFALVQPWLIAVAVAGGLLYWLGGSPRVSFWATVLGVAFTLLSWPSARAVEAWHRLGIAPEDDRALGMAGDELLSRAGATGPSVAK